MAGSNWLLLLVATAFVPAAAGCEQHLGTPYVRYDPTPHHIVAQMLELARVDRDDVVYDLGCGDGRIVIAAAKRGARGVCVDIDPERIRESRRNAELAGVAERIRFLNQDLFETEIGEATVVTLFLWPSVNEKLRPKLWRELDPGTRVVSYIHAMGAWRPVQTVNVESAHGPRKVFLWLVPARAASAGRISERYRRSHVLQRGPAALYVVRGSFSDGAWEYAEAGSLVVALAIAAFAAFPVNRWLIARGRGHALVHAHHY